MKGGLRSGVYEYEYEHENGSTALVQLHYDALPGRPGKTNCDPDDGYPPEPAWCEITEINAPSWCKREVEIHIEKNRGEFEALIHEHVGEEEAAAAEAAAEAKYDAQREDRC